MLQVEVIAVAVSCVTLSMRNGKWRNAEMRKWRVENKSVAARGSAVTHKQWQKQRIGEGKCACQSK